MNLKRTIKRKWGPDMTELTPYGGSLSGASHTPVDSISFCFGFYLKSAGKGGKSIWKGTGSQNERRRGFG